MPALLVGLQKDAGNHAVVHLLRQRAMVATSARTALQRAPVEGMVLTHESFGDWFFAKLDENKDALGLVVNGSGINRFVWNTVEKPGDSNDQHFRDREHLHLINNGTDVDISTKHTAPAPETKFGGSVRESKRAKRERQGQHPTGLKAVARGQPKVTICGKEPLPEGLPSWQKDTVGTLREMAASWLHEDGTEEQRAQFRA